MTGRPHFPQTYHNVCCASYRILLLRTLTGTTKEKEHSGGSTLRNLSARKKLDNSRKVRIIYKTVVVLRTLEDFTTSKGPWRAEANSITNNSLEVHPRREIRGVRSCDEKESISLSRFSYKFIQIDTPSLFRGNYSSLSLFTLRKNESLPLYQRFAPFGCL